MALLNISHPVVGGGKFIRYILVKHIFAKCGKHVNVERKANFGYGDKIEIGDYSGIGINASIPSDTIIGKYVMMGPNVVILSSNHKTDRTDIQMMFQGNTENKQTIIKDDVWIGRDVLMTPGRIVEEGSIIAARTVLAKDFPPYSIVGGNPPRVLKMRK